MRYDVRAYGVAADGATPVSPALDALIEKLSAGDELFFPAGRYYFPKSAVIRGKTDLSVYGEAGTVMIEHFDMAGPRSENGGIFYFTDCADVDVGGFEVTADAPVACAGTITAVDAEKHTFDVELDEGLPLTGAEHPFECNIYDEENTPVRGIGFAQYPDGAKTVWHGREIDRIGAIYEVVGERTARYALAAWQDPARIPVGKRVGMRTCWDTGNVLHFTDCARFLIHDITIWQSGGCGAVIGARSADFTFRGFRMLPPDDGASHYYMSNKDGIHIAGLTGKFVMEDCHFASLGDDALNIHSAAAVIEKAEGDRIEWAIQHHNGTTPVRPNWALPGDVIECYDRDTFATVSRFRVVGGAGGEITVEYLTDGRPVPGNICANTAYFCAAEIRNCTVHNTRARGFLFQTRHVLVENCHIFGTLLPSVIISPDIRFWYELGPSADITFRNNVFEKFCRTERSDCLASIVVKGSHDGDSSDYPAGVHRDIRIADNLFRNGGSAAVYLSATDGAEIRDNRMEGLCRVNRQNYMRRHEVILRSSARVTVEGNRTDRPSAFLYQKNCRGVKKA